MPGRRGLGIGIARGVITNPALHASAAAVIAVSLVLLATELISFPEPYDPDLEKRLSRRWFSSEAEPAGPRA